MPFKYKVLGDEPDINYIKPGISDPFLADTDGDGLPDGEDNCPSLKNPLQEDNDRDGMGDICDNDDDNDGYSDGLENIKGWPLGEFYCKEGDTDGDKICDSNDNCPSSRNPRQIDTDRDGLGDACDPDNGSLPDAQIDPNLPDEYEPDDDPNQASPFSTSLSYLPEYRQYHTFHEPNDTDWIWFFGIKGHQYELNLDANYLVNLTLINPLGYCEFDDLYNSVFGWDFSETGYYFLKIESAASPDVGAFSYTIWIIDKSAAGITPGVYGRVVYEDPNGLRNGINGLRVSLKSSGYEGEDITGSIGDITYTEFEPWMIDGWYFIPNLDLGTYLLTVTLNEDPYDVLDSSNIEITNTKPIRLDDIVIDKDIEHPPGLSKLYEAELTYIVWQAAYGGIYPPWEDTDGDGIINLVEFLNGTDPIEIQTLEFILDTGLNLIPFYLKGQNYAQDFHQKFLDKSGFESIWTYNPQEDIWLYWWPDSPSRIINTRFLDNYTLRKENFLMEAGKGYLIYMSSPWTFSYDYQDHKYQLVSGLNISPAPFETALYGPNSYEFLKNSTDEGIKIESISRYSNTQSDTVNASGTWESTYMFFGQPSGNNFKISPEEAYALGVKK